MTPTSNVQTLPPHTTVLKGRLEFSDKNREGPWWVVNGQKRANIHDLLLKWFQQWGGGEKAAAEIREEHAYGIKLDLESKGPVLKFKEPYATLVNGGGFGTTLVSIRLREKLKELSGEQVVFEINSRIATHAYFKIRLDEPPPAPIQWEEHPRL